MLCADVLFGLIGLTQFCVMNPRETTMDIPARQPYLMLHQPVHQAGVDGECRSGTQKLSSNEALQFHVGAPDVSSNLPQLQV